MTDEEIDALIWEAVKDLPVTNLGEEQDRAIFRAGVKRGKEQAEEIAIREEQKWGYAARDISRAIRREI